MSPKLKEDPIAEETAQVAEPVPPPSFAERTRAICCTRSVDATVAELLEEMAARLEALERGR